MAVKELLEERGKIEKTCRDIVNKAESEKRSFNAEEDKTWGELMTRDADLQKQIQRYQQMEKIKSDLDAEQRHGINKDTHPASAIGDQPDERAAMTAQQQRDCFNAWGRRQLGVELSKQQRDACKAAKFNPNQRQLSTPGFDTEQFRSVQGEFRTKHPSLVKQRDMSVGTANAGGYTIPQGFVNQLEMALLYFGCILQTADVLKTDSGNALPWPTVNDTGNTGEMLAEATSIGTSVDPVFASTTFNAYKFSSKLILVSSELLQDSAFDLASYLGSACGQRLGRIINTKGTLGTGSSQPQGIVPGSTLGKTAASATAIADTELIDLIHSCPIAYRSQPGVGFMMHDLILAVIRKLKDSEGRFIFQPGLQLGVPDKLLNYTVNINNDMQSTVATATKTILFGKLDTQKVRMVREIRLKRLVERYADTDQEGFVAFMRMDSKCLDAGGHPIRHLLQA